MAPVFMDRIVRRLADRINEKYPEPGGIETKLAVAVTISGFIGAIHSCHDVPDETLVTYLSEPVSKTMGICKYDS